MAEDQGVDQMKKWTGEIKEESRGLKMEVELDMEKTRDLTSWHGYGYSKDTWNLKRYRTDIGDIIVSGIFQLRSGENKRKYEIRTEGKIRV